MSKAFHLTVAKIDENLFDDLVSSVSLPGSEGVFEILAGHEPVVAELVPGNVRVTTSEGEARSFLVEGKGFVEFSHEQATVLL